jgi:hypothetical protein
VNETLFWLPAHATVGCTLILGAFLLSIAECIYRVENWLITWPLPPLERAERRELFEAQLRSFLERERREGYQPQFSGLRLLVRMFSTLPWDLCDGSGGLADKVWRWLMARQVGAALWLMRHRLDELDRRLRARHQDPYSDVSPRDIVWVEGHAQAQASASATLTVTPAVDEAAAFRMRIAASNQAMMESANQVIQQNRAFLDRAQRAAMNSMYLNTNASNRLGP